MNVKRIMLAAPRAAAMAALSPLDRALRARASDLSAPPVFIVGPPRSGTTLLYEALVTRYRFSYFSNISHRLHRTPVAGTWIGRNAIRSWTGNFESNYGHIPGWGSPNEGGWIWKRWIPEEHALDAGDVNDRSVQCMQQTVAAIAELIGAPFINKNVMHSVHMRLLDAIYPGCLFIECSRDITATARSILKARRDEFGESGMNEWLSVRPPGWEQVKDESPARQAVAQVALTRQAIERDAQAIGADRLATVSYEELCAAPEAMAGQVQAFLASHGVDVETRHALPERFERSAASSQDSSFRAELEQAVAESSDATATSMEMNHARATA